MNPTTDTNDPFDQKNVQITFEQQREISENTEGPTSDVRETRERLGDDMPTPALGEGPRKVDIDPNLKGSSFYDE